MHPAGEHHDQSPRRRGHPQADDIRARPRGKRRAVTPSGAPQPAAISIRRATEADRAVLERLAALDSARAPTGDILIAEVGDEPSRRCDRDGIMVANPFRPTANLVELLSHRAASLRDSSVTPRRFRLRQRRAHAAA